MFEENKLLNWFVDVRWSFSILLGVKALNINHYNQSTITYLQGLLPF